MLRILHVAHSRQGCNAKVERMRAEPGLRVRLVRPPDLSLDDTLEVPVWRRGDPHRCLYGTLTFGMRRFRPHLIHVEEEPDSLAALQACLARRACARRARLILHTWQNQGRPLGPAVRVVLRTTFRSADAILCANEEGQRLLRSQGFSGTTAVVLPQGVDLQVFSPIVHRRDRAAAFAVGYVGRLVPEKGCATLLEAVSRIGPPCSLTLVGEGPEERALRQLALDCGLDGRVRFTGTLPPALLARELAAFDVLVLPSRTTPVWKEQFGRALAEAMACGVPVVGSDSGAIPEVVGDAGLLFPEGDAGALAARLATRRADPGLGEVLGSRGRQRAASRFSATRLAEQTLAFYRQLAGAVAGAPS